MRGLTGALTNNIMLMKTKGMLFGIILAIGALVTYIVTSNETAHVASLLIFLLLLPLMSLNSSNIAFDSKWNRIERLWAVPIFTMIASRYIIYISISTVLAALWIISPFHDGDLNNIAHFVSLVLLTGALYFPFMYILNSDHNIGILVIFFSAFIGFISLNQIASRLENNNGFSFIMLGAVCAIYLVSLIISYSANQFHAGRGA